MNLCICAALVAMSVATAAMVARSRLSGVTSENQAKRADLLRLAVKVFPIGAVLIMLGVIQLEVAGALQVATAMSMVILVITCVAASHRLSDD